MDSDTRLARDRTHGAGARTWYFPDGDRPPGDGGPIEAHESLMVLNVSARQATVQLDLYWEDHDPTLGITVHVGAQRVRSLRVPWWEDPRDKERSDVPVICQYGRLEVIPSYALYTTMGYVDAKEEDK